jgi:hypothetical protein
MAPRIAARVARRWGAVIAVNLAATAAILIAADVYLRLEGHRPYRRTFPGEAYEGGGVPWARADPALGWTIEPAFLPGQINPQGFRDAKDIERTPRYTGITRVMLLGDSFVVGANLPAHETLPAVLQRRLGSTYEVFSVAVPGWGVDQMYLAYDRYKAALDPDMVVLAFIDDDILRVLEAYRSAERLAKPVLTVAGGKIVPQRTVPAGRRFVSRVLALSVPASLLAREYWLASEASDLAEAMFAAITRDMTDRGGRALVVRIPTRDDDDALDQLRRSLRGFESRFVGTPVTYLDGATETAGVAWSPDLYVADGHLNAAGTLRLADVLVRHLMAAH